MAVNLKTIYKTVDEIDEQWRELYSEKDGQFVLTGIEGLKTDADIAKLNDANKKEREAHKKTKDRLRFVVDLNDEQLKEVQEKLDKYEETELQLKTAQEELAKKDADAGKYNEQKLNEIADAKLRTTVKPLERTIADLTTKLAAAEEEKTKLIGNERNRLIKEAIEAAGVSAKMKPGAIGDAVELGMRLFEVSEEGKIIVRDQVGYTPGIEPDVWLSEIQPKKEHWWPESEGGNAKGAKGNNGFAGMNPWTAKNWNITEQGKLVRENAEKAKQLATAAGSSIGAIVPPSAK